MHSVLLRQTTAFFLCIAGLKRPERKTKHSSHTRPMLKLSRDRSTFSVRLSDAVLKRGAFKL